MRRICYNIHLYLGLVSSIIVFVICLSGTIYVFRPDVEKLLEPEKHNIRPDAGMQRQDVDFLISQFEHQQKHKVRSISIPENRFQTYMIVAANDSDAREPSQGRSQPPGRGRSQGTIFYVDPYSGQITGEGMSQAAPFFGSIMRLHRFLWLPTWIGRPIVGWATVVFVLISMTGLVLWIPRKWRKPGCWKNGFLISLRSGPKRLLFDLHNTLGFYLLIPVLLLALTGLCWSFGWYRSIVSFVIQEPVFAMRRETVSENTPPEKEAVPLSISEILKKQDEMTPSGDTTIMIPQKAGELMVIQKGTSGFWAFALKDQYEWDQYHGTLVKSDRFRDKNLGTQISMLIKPIHVGDVLGLGSRLFFFAVCLLATTLPVTGFWLWINQLRRKT